MTEPRIQWLPPQPAYDPPASQGPPPAYEPAPPIAPHEPSRPSRPQRTGLGRYLGPLLVAGALLLKFGAKGKALLLVLPKLKLFTTSFSMLLSIGAYSLIWGWKFAVGIVGLLFVHEMGHYIQMRREGVRPSAMIFIPFLGAAVTAKSLGGNALAEARVGLAGPVLGSLAAAALVPLAIATDSDLLRALAFTGFFLNLFNLLPVLPLDGGRAMAAMAPWMWLVGFAALVALTVLFPNPVMLLVLLFGGMETWRRWRARKHGEEGNANYYRVKPAHRLAVFGVYVALVAGLAIGMDLTFVDRSDRL